MGGAAMIGAKPATAAETLEQLPARTLRRPVANLMRSRRTADELIADAIVEIAQGDQYSWTHREALALIAALENERRPLGDWAAAAVHLTS